MKRIANFIPSLSGGGAERVVVNLLRAFDRNKVIPLLITGSATGPFADKIPDDVEVIDLKTAQMRKATRPLTEVLNRQKADLLISHLSHANIALLRAVRKANHRPKIAVVEHMTMSAYKGERWRDRLIKPLTKRLYPYADHVISVSNDAARDLEQVLSLPTGSVKTIYNPVVSPELEKQAQENIEHPLGKFKGKLILGVGRLSKQKDFSTLIKAFSKLHTLADTAVHLAILGTGEQESLLRSLIGRHELQDSVSLVGFQDNPYAWMRKADLFVLSSRWEALPTVLIEAMACGTNIVSTDCPSGPREILPAALHGHLVDVGDTSALAQQMSRVLCNPIAAEQWSSAVSHFSFAHAATAYSYLI